MESLGGKLPPPPHPPVDETLLEYSCIVIEATSKTFPTVHCMAMIIIIKLDFRESRKLLCLFENIHNAKLAGINPTDHLE